MDLKPARVTGEAHAGPHVEGNALSLTATLKPLDAAQVKEVRLNTIHKIIEIAEPREAVTQPTFCEKKRGCTGQTRIVSDKHDLRVTKMTGMYGKGTEPVEGPGTPASSIRPLAAPTAPVRSVKSA